MLLCMVQDVSVLTAKLDDLVEELKELHDKLDATDNQPNTFYLQQKIADKSDEIDNVKRLVIS